MLKAGVGLDECLETLANQSKGKLGEVLFEIHKDVVSGMTLADAVAKHEKIFNSYYVSMIRAGEESGNLVEDLEQLASRYEKDHDLLLKVRSALLYPSIVLALAIGLGISVTMFIFPKLITLFNSIKYELPWYTKAMISTAKFLTTYGWQTMFGIIIFIALIIYLAKKPFSAPVMHRFYLNFPIVGQIDHTLNMSRFCLIFGTLLKSGIPIAKALTITGNLMGNVVYKETLLSAVTRVKNGEPFSSVIEDSELFPLFAKRMLIIGEQTGKLTDMLLYLSNFYESELDSMLKNLSTILEPVLIVFIGLVVLSVALSIITPIYNFVGQVS
jgi:type IV pilus assembly protein PilC